MLQYCLWVVGLILEVLVLSALIRGPYTSFPFVFAYSITLFLTTVVEVAVSTANFFGARQMAKLYYWINDAVLQVLIFCVVISLIYKATSQASRQPHLRRWLILGAFLISTLSFLIHRDPNSDLSVWMTEVSRDLSFCSVILDLLLWSILIMSKTKDQRLLLLSGGLGIQFTGAAIGQSIRQVAHQHRWKGIALSGSVLVVLCAMMCLFVWWQALRRRKEAPGSALAAGKV